MTEEYTVVFSLIDQIDPETTRYQHAMIEAAREKPGVYMVYQVQFVCELESGQNHKGHLLHVFSKSILDDAACFNLEEYFEDWIRAWIEGNGFPEIMEPDRESCVVRSLESQERDNRGFAQQLTVEGR